MSDADDRADKITRIALDELANIDDTKKVLLRANEALILHELQQVLVRLAERDLIIEDMRGVIDTLSVGHVLVVDEVSRLKSGQSDLLRQHRDLRERQDILAAVCDAFAQKLEDEAKARIALAEEVADRD